MSRQSVRVYVEGVYVRVCPGSVCEGECRGSVFVGVSRECVRECIVCVNST